MRLVVLQPSYLPWLGYIEQYVRSDLFVVYDDVQYTKNDWRNRNRIKTPQGPQWLTVPVEDRHRVSQGLRIDQVRVRNELPWREKHLKSLRVNYGRAPFFDEVFPLLAEGLAAPGERLVDLNMELFTRVTGYLGVSRPVVLASATGTSHLVRSERLLALCRLVGADCYLSGAAARTYLDESLFQAAGVVVEWQDYHHPVYRQQWGGFVSHLSVVDLLFNHGRDGLAILTGRSGCV